jgi:hypothetical protein
MLMIGVRDKVLNKKAQQIMGIEESFYWWIWTVGCSKSHE